MSTVCSAMLPHFVWRSLGDPQYLDKAHRSTNLLSVYKSIYVPCLKHFGHAKLSTFPCFFGGGNFIFLFPLRFTCRKLQVQSLPEGLDGDNSEFDAQRMRCSIRQLHVFMFIQFYIQTVATQVDNLGPFKEVTECLRSVIEQMINTCKWNMQFLVDTGHGRWRLILSSNRHLQCSRCLSYTTLKKTISQL